MQTRLGMSDTAYGMSSGMFFDRILRCRGTEQSRSGAVSARMWIARIMSRGE